MISPSQLSHGFRLGPWQVEPRRGAITGPDGETRHLEPKVMEVLAILAGTPGELVTRDHLLDTVWRGQPGADQLLSHAVSELRRALDDRRDRPAYIETVPKRGYAMGNTSEAERFAQGVLDYEDRHARSREPYRLAYPRAAALTLLGQHDAAVELLQDSFARGFRKRWWYALERDPALQPLRRDPRFLALAAQARAHATAERQRLARLRERGDVPVRTTDRAPAPGPC